MNTRTKYFKKLIHIALSVAMVLWSVAPGLSAFVPTAHAEVNITAFDAIPDVSAGVAGSATYADAAAVILALPTTVTANTGAVTVPGNNLGRHKHL